MNRALRSLWQRHVDWLRQAGPIGPVEDEWRYHLAAVSALAVALGRRP